MEEQKNSKWYHRRFLQPLIRFLKQGMTPEKLALTVAIGATVGISPLFGMTTIILILLATIFRLNQAAIQVANYMVYPLQLILIIPNIRMGESVFHVPHFPLSVDEIKILFGESWIEGLLTFGKSMLIGSGFWLLYAIPLGILLYLGLIPVFRNAAERIRNNKV